MFRRIAVSVVLLCLFSASLSACSGAAEPQATDSISTAKPVKLEVDQASFDASLSRMQIATDEFTGLTSIGPKASTDLQLKDGSGVNSKSTTMKISLARVSENEPYMTTFFAVYMANEWINFDSLNLKSGNGRITLLVNPANKMTKVQGGGVISEGAPIQLSAGDRGTLWAILQAAKVDFRLNGSSGSYQKSLTNAQIAEMKDALVISKGLESGLKLK